MGGSRIFDGIEWADRGVCGKPCTPTEVDRGTSVCCGDHSGIVPCGSPSCGARGVARRRAFCKILALLAALVSASVFSVLLLGARKARPSGDSLLAGREADCRPLLAYRRGC